MGDSKETSSTENTKKKRGWGEIENLFNEKKEKKKADAVASVKKAEEKKRRKKTAPPVQSADGGKGKWTDDGLGGKYNEEGYTGRVEDGIRIFKAHVLRKQNTGTTDQCPFDCQCCLI